MKHKNNMWRKLFIALLGLTASLPMAAQYNSGNFEANEASFYYGVRMGIHSGWLGGDIDSKAQAGMSLGAVVGLRVVRDEPIFLESGLYYSERGGKLSDGKVHLNYLEVPVLIKGGFAVTDDIVLLPFVGPYFAMGISGQTVTSTPEGNLKRSSYNEFKHFDMGFKLGLGAEYSLFYLELGYQFGVHDMSKNDISARTRGLYANFGINF